MTRSILALASVFAAGAGLLGCDASAPGTGPADAARPADAADQASAPDAARPSPASVDAGLADAGALPTDAGTDAPDAGDDNSADAGAPGAPCFHVQGIDRSDLFFFDTRRCGDTPGALAATEACAPAAASGGEIWTDVRMPPRTALRLSARARHALVLRVHDEANTRCVAQSVAAAQPRSQTSLYYAHDGDEAITLKLLIDGHSDADRGPVELRVRIDPLAEDASDDATTATGIGIAPFAHPATLERAGDRDCFFVRTSIASSGPLALEVRDAWGACTGGEDLRVELFAEDVPDAPVAATDPSASCASLTHARHRRGDVFLLCLALADGRAPRPAVLNVPGSATPDPRFPRPGLTIAEFDIQRPDGHRFFEITNTASTAVALDGAALAVRNVNARLTAEVELAGAEAPSGPVRMLLPGARLIVGSEALRAEVHAHGAGFVPLPPDARIPPEGQLLIRAVVSSGDGQTLRQVDAVDYGRQPLAAPDQEAPADLGTPRSSVCALPGTDRSRYPRLDFVQGCFSSPGAPNSL